MRLAVFNWRDRGHPRAGGAETLTHQLCSGMGARGHRMTLFTSSYRGAAAADHGADYEIVRAGGQMTCRLHAAAWLRRRAADFDLVVDEVNTLPFFSPWIAPRVALLSMQLAREVWLAEGPPFFGALGYALEPWYMRIYRRSPLITISASSAASLAALGLRGETHVIGVAVEPRPPGLEPAPVTGRIGYVGRITRSKRVIDLVRATALVRRRVPHAHLVIVGGGDASEVARVNRLAAGLGIADAVRLQGRLDDSARDAAMAQFDVVAMASLREGWGLSITEAGRFRVPAAVYPVAGLVDSVDDGVSGLHARASTPDALADAIAMIIEDRALRERLGARAAASAAEFTPRRLVDRFEGACRQIAGAAAL